MSSIAKLGGWLRRRAENVLAALLGTMFAAFVVQIVFRYFFNLPTGWTSELIVITWLWLVLWGAAFVISDEEEIRIDLVTGMVSARVRRIMLITVGLAITALYTIALPATFSYVTFMRVEKSSYLKIPMDVVYSVFLLFIVAVVVRQVYGVWRLLRGKAPGEADPTKMASGL